MISSMALKPVEIQKAEARFPGIDECIIEHQSNRCEERAWKFHDERAASIKDHIPSALSGDVGDGLRNG